MNKKTMNEISKLVKDSLPGMVGDELKEILENYDNALKRAKKAEDEIIDREERLRDSSERLDVLKAQLDEFRNRETSLIERENCAAEKEELNLQAERNITVKMLSFQNQVLDYSLEKNREFMINMSHNTTFRKSITATKPVVIPGSGVDQYGNEMRQPYTEQHTDETVITTTEE